MRGGVGGKEVELDEKEAEYIRQVNTKEIDEMQFQELVGELNLERVLGESVAEEPATTQATTQDKEIGESEQDESAEEEPEVASKVVELSTVTKGKRKVAPMRAKMYAEVDGPVSCLLKLTSICANIYAHSVTDVSCGRHSQSVSPHPMSGTARSAQTDKSRCSWRGRSHKVVEGEVTITSKRSRGQLVSQVEESSSRDEVQEVEVSRGKF
jgi:hypothetical protein